MAQKKTDTALAVDKLAAIEADMRKASELAARFAARYANERVTAPARAAIDEARVEASLIALAVRI